MLKKRKEELKFPWYVSVNSSYDKEETEICYWRKCWGIRRDILYVLSGEVEEQYEYPIKAEEIPTIIKILENYLDRDYWNENARSIWNYESYLNLSIQYIKNLLWLKEYLEENPDTECYFYDSY